MAVAVIRSFSAMTPPALSAEIAGLGNQVDGSAGNHFLRSRVQPPISTIGHVALLEPYVPDVIAVGINLLARPPGFFFSKKLATGDPARLMK